MRSTRALYLLLLQNHLDNLDGMTTRWVAYSCALMRTFVNEHDDARIRDPS